MPTQAARHAHSWRRVRIFSLAALTCLTSGLLTVLAGWLLPPFVSSRLQAAILQSVLWTPNAPPDVQQRYTSNVYPGAPPAYLSVWMMNITNLDGVRAGEKPVLVRGSLAYTRHWQGTWHSRRAAQHHQCLTVPLGRAAPSTSQGREGGGFWCWGFGGQGLWRVSCRHKKHAVC